MSYTVVEARATLCKLLSNCRPSFKDCHGVVESEAHTRDYNFAY